MSADLGSVGLMSLVAWPLSPMSSPHRARDHTTVQLSQKSGGIHSRLSQVQTLAPSQTSREREQAAHSA